MKYFEFTYIETKDGQIINQGTELYYTSAEPNLDQMKTLAKETLKNTTDIISIPLFTEIDKITFVSKGGNPNI